MRPSLEDLAPKSHPVRVVNEVIKNYNAKRPFSADKRFYNPKKDCYICPMGQQMDYVGNSKRKTSTGFEQTFRMYQAKNCYGCRLNGPCHKSKGNRIIEINVDT